MPKLHYVKAAQKDNPAVKKGEPYYWWKFRFGGKRYSATRPSRSQLTQSEFYGTLYDLEDTVFDGSKDEVADQLEEMASAVRELGEQAQESFDNLPENFQYAPTGELLEARAAACEELADAIEELTNDMRAWPEEGDEEFEEEEHSDPAGAAQDWVGDLDWGIE